MKVRPIFAWYDLYVGFYYDRIFRSLYFFPVPMFGIRIDFAQREGKEQPADAD